MNEGRAIFEGNGLGRAHSCLAGAARRLALSSLAALTITACAPHSPASHTIAPEVSASTPSSIDIAVADARRPAADRARDTGSKPAELLKFAGIAPGMAVFDFHAAGGYYSELLSYVVGPQGRVIAHMHPGAEKLGPATFEQRYGNNRLPNTEQLWARHAEIKPTLNSLDAVWMSMVYHDTYWHDDDVDWGPVDQQDLLRIFYQSLRPGGVILVIDHVAQAGTDPEQSAVAMHRIDPAIVQRDFEAAGFVLEAESDILRNSRDQPALSVFDEAVYGKTDRFVMRFRRP